MSVQADKWIKKMAKEHGMISPFEESFNSVTNGHTIIFKITTCS